MPTAFAHDSLPFDPPLPTMVAPPPPGPTQHEIALAAPSAEEQQQFLADVTAALATGDILNWVEVVVADEQKVRARFQQPGVDALTSPMLRVRDEIVRLRKLDREREGP